MAIHSQTSNMVCVVPIGCERSCWGNRLARRAGGADPRRRRPEVSACAAVAFWRKGDNEVGVVTCWPTFQRSAREGSSQRSLLWGWQTTFSMFASASGRGWERGAPPRGGERRAPGAADLVRAASPHSHCPQHQRSRAGRRSRSARARGLRGRRAPPWAHGRRAPNLLSATRPRENSDPADCGAERATGELRP